MTTPKAKRFIVKVDDRPEVEVMIPETDHTVEHMADFIRDVAALSCAEYPNTVCDDCITCRARALLARIEGGK
jgi:hypothetical protein